MLKLLFREHPADLQIRVNPILNLPEQLQDEAIAVDNGRVALLDANDRRLRRGRIVLKHLAKRGVHGGFKLPRNPFFPVATDKYLQQQVIKLFVGKRVTKDPLFGAVLELQAGQNL